ncbi:CD109 antigen [Periophthalmus magnuspinnatus]|uniref:CD109 antigen n=1 Tax=Periophthalmus magnuspinnatus TaxID=409849 RepID=UPI00243679F1|nr:CD109 antigen [Periophthalmus magnuspinnatus]
MACFYRIGLYLGMISLNVPGSHQQSPSSLFLVSVPEQIHAGMPTSLAVTIIADFSVRVTAEVVEGNVKMEKSEEFTKDVTGLLTLPPIYDSNLKSSSVTLTVRGYKGDEVIFTNTTTIAFNPRNVTTFIQTDRPRYPPGDRMRVRVASVDLNNYPYHGKVELSINNPNGNTMDRFQSSGNNGILLRDFILPQTAPLGQWTVVATINGLTDVTTFFVEHFENPVFDILINTPSHVLSHEDILGSVRALYSSGQPVHGIVKVTLTLVPTTDDDSTFTLTRTKEIYGSAQFHFSKDDLHPLIAKIQRDKDVMVSVHAAVTSNSTGNKGIEVTKQVTVQISKEIYRLTLHDYSQALKPGMPFFAKLKISRFDQQSLSSVDMRESALIEITQRTSSDAGEPTSLSHPVPKDGIVRLGFRLQAEVEALFIQARFQSSIVALNLSKTHPSPSASYIQIYPINSTQIGSPVQITLESSVQLKLLHYVVKSRGQVVAAGTKEFGSFSLTPTAAWAPQACVTIYYVLANGEILSDTADILVKQQQISLSWSSNMAQPGEQMTLSVTGPESGSVVGIVIMRTHDSTPEVSTHFEVEQECFVQMLTNGKLYKTRSFDGSTQDMIEKYWYHFMDGAESLLWLDATMSDTTWTSEKITVPDGVNSLRAAAFVMSQRHGLGFTSQKLSITKDFSLSLNVPPYLIRGEEIVLEVNIVNHLHRDLEVILLLAESDAFEFVMAERGSLSVVNAQKLTLGSHVSAKAMFPVKVTALGEVDISVDAVSADASESLVWTVFVKPEGVEESVSENIFLELPPSMNTFSRSTAFTFPAGVISDSCKAYLAIGGDLLALSFHQLDSLVDLPLGCGEQNMVHFAPSIYVLRYLMMSDQDDAEIRSRAMKHLEEGYQRQLAYQRSDGSFGAFGASDSSGSTWLTAFVVKCFQLAQTYITVDQNVLTRARDWMLKQQGAEGVFREVGTAMHTEMQAGLDDGPVALTAYVLITLLEDPVTVGRYADQILLAQSYLENKISTEVVSNYSLSLTAYALSIANSPKVSMALEELSKRADNQDGSMIWMSSGGTRSHEQSHSVQIEIAAYVLLAYLNSGDIVKAIPVMKWLCNQRNHLGGFFSTQDTMIALQALAHFAAFSGAIAIDLSLKITDPTTTFSSIFHINITNYRMYQSQEIDVNDDLKLDIYMEGRGFATFQMNIFYNMDSKTFSENLQNIMNEEAFLLNVDVYTQGNEYNRLQLSVCMRLKDTEKISKTGMAILDVGMLSGFTISPGATTPTDLIPKTETLSDKVILYFHTLNTTEVCITLPLIRIYKVAQIQDAVVRVYDYYEPTRKATRTYNLDNLRTLDSCVFCGEDCELCKPGVSIIVSGITSHSVISTTNSLMCLLLTAICMTG